MPNPVGLAAVVTGAADGIGRAIALELAELGMRLAVLDIRGEAAEATAMACARTGAPAIGLACDVSLEAELEAAAERVARELGPVSLVWANAGVGSAGGLLASPREILRWLYAVNVDGVIDTIRAFLPALTSQSGWRRVAITGSVAGLTEVAPGRPMAYAATKYAVTGVAEALRPELGALGIGLTLVCPGSVDTRKWDGARARPARFGGAAPLPDEAGRAMRRSGIGPEVIGKTAVQAVREGRPLLILPEDEARASLLERRAGDIRRAVQIAAPLAGSDGRLTPRDRPLRG